MIKSDGVFWKYVLVLVLFMVLTPFSLGAPLSEIWFEVEDVSGGRWQYTYDVANVEFLAGIDEFTIYFPDDLYDGLVVETTGVLAAMWNEIVWDPIVGVAVDGGYDVLAVSSPIGASMTASGYSVSFDWLGDGIPGSQYYEIVNPNTFETVDSGWTVPEPGMLLLFGLGVLIRQKKRK